MTNTYSIHHLALTASDVETSSKIYDIFLGKLGYRRHFDTPNFAGWTDVQPEILMYKSKGDAANQREELYRPGIHHIAFIASSNETIDAIFEEIRDLPEIFILDAPCEYPHYAPGYYALYFQDPDGIKIEIAHIPNPISH